MLHKTDAVWIQGLCTKTNEIIVIYKRQVSPISNTSLILEFTGLPSMIELTAFNRHEIGLPEMRG